MFVERDLATWATDVNECVRSTLSKLRDLPDETVAYCAHEYTEANARFAMHLGGIPKLADRVAAMKDITNLTISIWRLTSCARIDQMIFSVLCSMRMVSRSTYDLHCWPPTMTNHVQQL